MINTLDHTPFARSRFQRFFAASTAIFFATSIATMAALTPAQKEIEAYIAQLFPTKNFDTASDAEFTTATIAAINNPMLKPKTAPSAILTAALKPLKAPASSGRPQLAPAIAQAALTKAYSATPGQALTTPTKIGTDAAKSVAEAFKYAVPTSAVLGSQANIAAAITSVSVNAVKTIGIQPGQKLTPLQNVITAAIKAVKAGTIKAGGFNGIEGVIVGGVSQVGGVDNDTFGTDPADVLVSTILTTAAKNVSAKQLTQVATAAGYAFAALYRKTTGSDIGLDAFLTKNQAALALAIISVKKLSDLAKAQITNSVAVGIKLAYSGGTDTFGSKGIGEFAYNNGNGTPVTDTTGL